MNADGNSNTHSSEAETRPAATSAAAAANAPPSLEMSPGRRQIAYPAGAKKPRISSRPGRPSSERFSNHSEWAWRICRVKGALLFHSTS